MNRTVLSKIAFSAVSVITVSSAVLGSEKVHRLAKPLMIPALAAGLRRCHPALAVALTSATVGDILLIDPDDDRRILGGARSFAVMQGCYIGLLATAGARPTVNNAIPRVAGWAAASALLAQRSPTVAPGLAAYGLTLATMSTLAADASLAPGSTVRAGLVIPNGDPRSAIAIGGVLFTVSDALIVFRRLFLTSQSHRRAAEGAILATYAVAQLLIVDGLSGEQ